MPTDPSSPAKRPVVIVVRDGWGKNPDPRWDNANAVALARHPVADQLLADYPNTLIHTSGFDVGLPEGTMGNSEVGHQNIGAGRIVDQESVKITKEVRNGTFSNNPEMVAAVEHVKRRGSKLHLFGIVSDAGVHGQLEHLYGCLDAGQSPRADPRVPPRLHRRPRHVAQLRAGYVEQVEAKMADIGVGHIATVSGRFYAMDRDNRWPRVEKAFRAIRFGQGVPVASATAAVRGYYANPTEPNMTGDEFVVPSVVTDANGAPLATVADGDAVIFYNYRGDRPAS